MPWTKPQADAVKQDNCTHPKEGERKLTYKEAIREAQAQALESDHRVFIMGEGVDDPKGIFGTTLNLHQKFGDKRVFDLPLSENGFTGIAVGAAIVGMCPIIVHQRMDFLLLSMDQIINHAAKWRYMFGGKQHVPLTIRSIIGRGWGSAAQHSQSLQALFLHVPGLKLIMPSNAYDVKGLLLASIADPDPVIFIEHRWLYNEAEHVPKKMYVIPLGKGTIKRKGKDVTIVAISYMVFEVMQVAKQLYEQYGIDAEIIDLRTINPMDEDLLFASVRKTGRLIVADTGWKTGGVAAEIIARVAEKNLSYLKAPMKRVSLPDAPTPVSPVLEKAYYPGKREIITAVKRVMGKRLNREEK